MMTNKDRAARGALAYSAVRHDDNDPITNIYDLVADLFHYADTFSGRVIGFENEDGRQRIGSYVSGMASMHYEAEISEEEAFSNREEWTGGSITFGRDEDGDFFVNISTEDVEDPDINDETGNPLLYVYLNDATVYDPTLFLTKKKEES